MMKPALLLKKAVSNLAASQFYTCHEIKKGRQTRRPFLLAVGSLREPTPTQNH